MTTEASFSLIEPFSLGRTLAGQWWLFLLRGLAAVAFGALALIWTGITLQALVLLFGAYAVSDGVFALAAGIMGGNGSTSRWWLLIVGLAGVGAGLATFIWPAITALVLLFFIAGWAFAAGLLQIAGAIELRRENENEWPLMLDGLVSVAVGVALLAMPQAGALALVWLIGLYAVLFGILMTVFAFKLRSLNPRAG